MRLAATGRALALAAMGVGALVVVPAGCFFPDYTFDLKTSSGGTGGTTASTTSSSTSTTSTGTGGTPPTEDCLNGVDDDGDQLVDCADPDCGDYECVDPAPTGWTTPGLVTLYEGLSGQSPPACPDEMPTQAYAGHRALTYQPATCSPCDCQAPKGQDCQLTNDRDTSKTGIQAVQVSNKACGEVGTQFSYMSVPDPPWDGVCYHWDSLAGGQTCGGLPCNVSVTSGLPTVSGGTCAPSGGTPFKPTPSWAADVLACTGTKQGGGCSNGQLCVPKPKTPFKAHVCVQQAGDVACPSGPYANKNLYHSGFNDQRDCTTCQCGPASGGTCEITISLWSDPDVGNCSTSVASFKAGQCVDLPTTNPAIYGLTDSITTAPSGGKCTPTTTSTPFGGVTEQTPTTFCCL